MARSIAVISTLGILAHCFVLREYVVRMSSEGHYQFFWLAIIATVGLFYFRKQAISDAATAPLKSIINVLWACCLVAVVTANLINSSFLGWLSFLLFLTTTLYHFAGRSGLTTGAGCLTALLLLTPLPGQLDEDLIIRLQHLASQFASWILDAFGVFHFRQGVVLISETNGFLAEEACSGIRSLFSGIFAIIFWGFTQRFPWWRHGVNFFQVIGWVLLGNALRIAMVVWVEDKTPYSVASGMPHEMLGLLFFLLIVGLAISFDRLLFNLLLRAPDPVEPEEDLAFSEQKNSKLNTSPMHIGWIIAFMAVAALSIRLNFAGTATPIDGSYATLSSPLETDLPTEITGWQVNGYEEIIRNRESIQGERSFVWRLNKGPQNIAISMDGDWDDFHDLSYCYTGLGWQVKTTHNYVSLLSTESESPASDRNFSVLELSKPTGEQGLVVFCGIDRTGKIVQPPIKLGQNTATHLQEKSLNSLRLAFGLQPLASIRATTFRPPVTTLQIYYVPNGPMAENAITAMTDLLFETREIATRSQRFEPGQ